MADTSSWDAAHRDSTRLAAADPAHQAARAIMDLLDSERKRSVTIQWMPDEDGRGCRFEAIEVRSGDYLYVVRVDVEGRVTFDG